MEILLILILLAFFGISYYIKNRIIPRIKGAIGEYKVAIRLRFLNKKDYIVLNDILIANDNLTTQIDHIVISKSGIFVIETKNYKGWIHGHENSEYWKQTLYKYKKELRNPIKQNWVHVYALKKLLADYKYLKYYPIVVFAGSGKLKNITTSLPVIYTNKLLRTIRNINVHNNLSYSQIRLIADKLHQHNIIDRKENENHIRQVRKQVSELKKKEKLKICPRCSNNLIQKKGKYGSFYGCENFPKCKYTRSR